MAIFIQVVEAVLMVLGGLVVLLKVIAPLTDTKLDDKLAGKLSAVADFLKKMVG